MGNTVYRAINTHPEIPNRSNLIRPNVNMEKMGDTQDVEACKYFYKITPCTVFQKLIGPYDGMNRFYQPQNAQENSEAGPFRLHYFIKAMIFCRSFSTWTGGLLNSLFILL